MERSEWLAYGDLAWTDTVVSSPEDVREDTEYFCELIRSNSRIEVKTLLHLGCGAGFNDFTFKREFVVTGVDVSEGMLKMARKLNPEVRYIQGDMRNLSLNETFDAVTIPDSIGYMTTEEDLRKAISTANGHLRPGGVLLIVALVSEEFMENNFAYAGSQGDLQVTIFEKNQRCWSDPAIYEAVLVYLIRRQDELEVICDLHRQGLFPSTVWLSLLEDLGLEIRQKVMEDSYDDFLLGEGRYRLRAFLCRKPL
ncbi:MAG: Methyltransferase type 11 [Methanothrix sp.]|jgi:SAM-dependent methyltransferase|nr:MAG: Methyltransferase type 11 [Methanothrix sp.]